MATASQPSHSNFGVDYVIHYKVPPSGPEKAEAEAAFVQLIQALADVGFVTEARPGRRRKPHKLKSPAKTFSTEKVPASSPPPPSAPPSSLLVFIRIASPRLLASHVYHARLQDWLYGIRTAAPEGGGPDADESGNHLARALESEPVSEAERLRLAYLLITRPRSEGGAGITPGSGMWKYVTAVFPLHDRDFNRDWIKRWSTKYYLEDADMEMIRDRFGERVAFYFAFLRSYFAFLLFPAAFGFATWLLLGSSYSCLYAVVNCLWSVVFFEHWKMKEVDLAVGWGVRGVSKIQTPRPQFRFDRVALDPVTGEKIRIYSPLKRLARQMLQVPFALACILVLGSLIASCFAIEIFITEVYTGPFKSYLTFLPTILLTIFTPTISTILSGLAERLTDFENYQTRDAHQAAFVQKIFVLNFVTSYLPIFLTAFVYVPFGKELVPYLNFLQLTAEKFTTNGQPLPAKAWQIDPDRLTKQVIYFTVTAQIVNFAMETIMPYAKWKVFNAFQGDDSMVSPEDGKHGRSPSDVAIGGHGEGVRVPTNPAPTHYLQDDPAEAVFLKRVREEAELDEYDVTTDYREMVVQFGYLSLFSVVWPLTACSFLINNWVEARGDAVKIASSRRRPIPWRGDSIGPWLDALGFLSWLGSITSAALVFLFSGRRGGNSNGVGDSSAGPDGSPGGITGWALLLFIVFAEHVYLVVQFVVRGVMGKMDRPGLQKERAERFAMRKQVLEQTMGLVDFEAPSPVVGPGNQRAQLGRADSQVQMVTRQALEQEAQRASAGRAGDHARRMFWQRQRGAVETIEAGRALISNGRVE